MKRRYNILDFEIRNCNGGVRLKLMGRDRFCNRYWYFDASNGSVSLDAVTKTPLDPSVLEKPFAADPDIPYDYSTGVLFVEEFGVSSLTPKLQDEFSDLRLGLLDGSWGYLSTPKEVRFDLCTSRQTDSSPFSLLHSLNNFIAGWIGEESENQIFSIIWKITETTFWME